ncbi:glucan Synthse like 5 [Selaginella moellendorffii]|uniref:1,3-beta-glucan synthase n=1 Tax=Selaginella moellendorffii TaxID=88036 RepID=D8T772_SELML|nr:glucan Synthse like 5 [Selaginella moellendorffii]
MAASSATDHASQLLEVENSVKEELKKVRKSIDDTKDEDILDYLRDVCKFQEDNVRNQREHIVQLIANTCSVHKKDISSAIQHLAAKTLENYKSWYTHSKSWSDDEDSEPDQHSFKGDDHLMSLCLYLLIWGEAANLRFMPECLCFIFHKMKTSIIRHNAKAENGFLESVITPVYLFLKKDLPNPKEKERKRSPIISHRRVANYDDLNELFWTSQCLKDFKWDHNNLKLKVPRFEKWQHKQKVEEKQRHKKKVEEKWPHKKKVNFIEHRTFLHIFHSFHRLWIFFTIMLQALLIIAFTQSLKLKYLLLFGPTHAFLMFFQSTLDIVFTYGAYVKHNVRIALQFLFYGVATGIQTFLSIKSFQENEPETSVDYFKIYEYVASFYLVAHLAHAIGHSLLSFFPTDKGKSVTWLKWIFKERYFIGSGMQVRPLDFLKYASFWIVLLAAKFFVSYKTQIYFLDTQIWYVVFSAILGCLTGGIAHLGEMRSMYMFAKQFREMPKHFEKRLVQGSGEPVFYKCWNELISKLREEDYLSDNEKELFVMPPPKNFTIGNDAVNVNRWPLFIVVNEVQLAVSLSARKDHNELLRRLSKEGYLRDAIEEIFFTVGEILDRLGVWTNELKKNDFYNLEHAIYNKKATDLLKMWILITSRMVQDLLDDKILHVNWKDQELNTLSVEKLRLEKMLNGTTNVLDVPRNGEARRRLLFFGNSLLMKMPKPPSVDRMLSFSVLTPYLNEEVVYSTKDLHKENKDGITTLYYLQRVYPDEWKNFNERMEKKSLSEHDKSVEIGLWASYRSQTLARTVRGMMYYYDALKFQRTGGDGDELIDFVAARKFTYIVAAQRYSEFKKSKDTNIKKKATDIELLMNKHPLLRVAYIDEDDGTYSSKLAMLDGKDIQTIYSIKLPGDFLIGEGKPENQNHAIIFTRGEALQTIDMNQDNYFEEALKMRNLLEEFRPPDKKPDRQVPTILGVREHVFTGSVSSLAWFMSNQETTFVTLSQRVMANPLKIRMHYGHPDVFDRIFHITRGGISKASRTINLSEDIFAGYNSTLRGGMVTHHEYIQVGKGRDLGLNQISAFEAKVSSGNGEQILSRDVYRLARFFDFWRMLSFYYTSVGFYISTAMIVVALYAYLYGKVYMVLSGVEKDMLTKARIEGNNALESVLATQAIFQYGFLNCAPMVTGYILEQGFIKYRSTGRGFVIEHVHFAENYRFYSRSHFVKGLEIAMLLFVYVVYGAQRTRKGYVLLALDIGFLAICWLYAPFFFNPLSFEWQKTVDDITNWNNWLTNKSHSAPDYESWATWWEKQTDLRGFRARAVECILSLRFFLIQFGVAYHLRSGVGTISLLVYASSWVLFVCIGLLVAFLSLSPRSSNKLRFVHFLAFIVLLAAFITGCVFTLRLQVLDVIASILALIPTGWGILSIGIACKPWLRKARLWWLMSVWAWSYDVGMGYVIFAPIIFLSWFPFISPLHTRILFNQAFSRGLEISVLLSTPITTTTEETIGRRQKEPSEEDRRRSLNIHTGNL